MNNLNLKNTAEELLSTFIEAGEITRKISQRGAKITIKSDKSPVTDADLAVDELLKTKIKSLTPNIPIISEETVDLNSNNQDKTFWLIDPIDGTRDYIKKKDEYTLNAGLKGLAFEINHGKKIVLNCKKKKYSRNNRVGKFRNNTKWSYRYL